jgi:phosphate butyryltransferase
MKSIFDLLSEKKENEPKRRLGLVGGESVYALQACKVSMDRGLIEPVFIGDQAKIKGLIKAIGFSSDCEIIDADSPEATATKAVTLAKEKKIDILMKGQIETSLLLRALLNKKTGLPPKGLISAVSLFEYKGRPLLLTDAAVNISPDLEMKVEIIKNVLSVGRGLGIKTPKVAALSPMEKVNPRVIETVHAKELSDMSERGVFGDAIVHGPMALDLALSAKSVKQKNYEGPMAGDADVLFAPDLSSANILHKAFALLTDCPHAAVVAGCHIPLIINSRSENEFTKFNSIAMASYLAGRKS